MKVIDKQDNLKNLLELKNVTEESADLYFYGDIVSSWWGAWDDTDQYPESVKNFLAGAKGKNLNIHINSGGGSVFAGITIFNMIKNHEGTKTVYIDGIAASIASVIALAGDKVIMRTGSSLMVHKPSYGIYGYYNSNDFKKLASDLDVIQECIMQVYKEKLKEDVDLSTIEKLVNEETYLTSEEAEKYFNVEIEIGLEAVACNSEYLERFANIPVSLREKINAKKPKEKQIDTKIVNLASTKLNLIKLGGRKMGKEKYLARRKELMDEAQNLINEGKVEEANAKIADIEKLDTDFENAAKAQANMNALKDKVAVPNVVNSSVSVGEEEIIDNFKTPLQPKNEKDMYLNAWAKDMMGLQLNTEEQQVFDKVNDDFRRDPKNAAFTHTTENTGIVIPETVVAGIWKEIEDTYPLYQDVNKLYIKGNLTMLKSTSSSDAKWYDEPTETEDGKEEFGQLNLTGCELSRSITVSWKLKAMAIDQFIPFIQSQLAEKLGAALGYGVAVGKGKPGESDTFKPEPKGILTALKAETDSPQVVTYSDADKLSYEKFTKAMSLIKSGYLKGAAVYADNVTIWNQIATLLDGNKRPYFIPDVTSGGVGKIFGLTVKEDESIPTGEILLGNAKKGYLVNINQDVMLDSEDRKKARETDYIAYGIVDGDMVTSKAFALIKK